MFARHIRHYCFAGLLMVFGYAEAKSSLSAVRSPTLVLCCTVRRCTLAEHRKSESRPRSRADHAPEAFLFLSPAPDDSRRRWTARARGTATSAQSRRPLRTRQTAQRLLLRESRGSRTNGSSPELHFGLALVQAHGESSGHSIASFQRCSYVLSRADPARRPSARRSEGPPLIVPRVQATIASERLLHASRSPWNPRRYHQGGQSRRRNRSSASPGRSAAVGPADPPLRPPRTLELLSSVIPSCPDRIKSWHTATQRIAPEHPTMRCCISRRHRRRLS